MKKTSRCELELWNTRDGHESGVAGRAATLHRVKTFDEIINDEAKIHASTLKTVEQFQYILDRIMAYMKQTGLFPLFRDHEERSSDPRESPQDVPQACTALDIEVQERQPPTVCLQHTLE